MEQQKDDFGKNIPWILVVSLVLAVGCGVSAETNHWLSSIALGFGVGFLSLFALSSAFLSK